MEGEDQAGPCWKDFGAWKTRTNFRWWNTNLRYNFSTPSRGKALIPSGYDFFFSPVSLRSPSGLPPFSLRSPSGGFFFFPSIFAALPLCLVVCFSNFFSLFFQVGELFFELHNGTYTTQAACKKFNRKSEFLLTNVEIFSIFAKISDGTFDYPKQELDR
jgi:hypothetical protein